MPLFTLPIPHDRHDLFDLFFQSFWEDVLTDQIEFDIDGTIIAQGTAEKEAWDEYWLSAKELYTRNHSQVAVMQSEFTAIVGFTQVFASAWITSNPKVTLLFIAAHGGREVKTTKTPIGRSTITPSISYHTSQPHEIKLRIINPSEPTGPSSEAGYRIYTEIYIGAKGLEPSSILWGNAVVQKGRYINFDQFTDAQQGLYCYFRSCYINTKGEKGTFSNILCLLIN